MVLYCKYCMEMYTLPCMYLCIMQTLMENILPRESSRRVPIDWDYSGTSYNNNFNASCGNNNSFEDSSKFCISSARNINSGRMVSGRQMYSPSVNNVKLQTVQRPQTAKV